MALIKFTTNDPTQADIIADVDTPLVLTAVAVDRFTMAITHPTLNTLEVQWQVNLASIAETTLVANQVLNAAIEAGVADPYAIPDVSEMQTEGGYLMPNTLYPLIDYTLA